MPPLCFCSSTSPPPAGPAWWHRDDDTGGWSGSFLYRLADFNLTLAVEQRSLASRLVRCDGQFAFNLSNNATHQLMAGFNVEDVKGEMMTGLALHLPCRWVEGHACPGLWRQQGSAVLPCRCSMPRVCCAPKCASLTAG